MHVVKKIGIILLALYLILVGLVNILGVGVPAIGLFLIHSLAVAAGILFLITLGSCCHHHCESSDHHCNSCDTHDKPKY